MEELLNGYMELEQQMRAKTEEIKAAAKAQAMAMVTDYLSNGRSDDAKQVIDKLEKLDGLELVMNTVEIMDFVTQMTNEKAPTAKQVAKNKLANNMSTVTRDMKSLMETRGYKFLNKEGEEAMRFVKDEEYYYLYSLESLADVPKIEVGIAKAIKFTNLIYILPTEAQKEQMRLIVRNWIQNNANEAMKKYLKIQVSSIEKLQRMDSVLEKVSF